jgi:molybdopterin-guanine dinucleotide biosynthesis protein A
MSASLTVGGIVLCGGQSTRMGSPKAWLPVGPEVMLERVVRIVAGVVSPIVVVAAEGQSLPELPPSASIARDENDSLGPLAGLAAGLKALRSEVDAVYVSSCDVPLLKPEFIRHVIAALGDHDMAIPHDGRGHHPLAAVYRTRVESTVRELIAGNQLRLRSLLERLDARLIDEAALRAVDRDLKSLRNVNSPEEYSAVLRDAGFAEAAPRI